jgi:hypothetical protein
VSSILDALRKLEAAETPGGARPVVAAPAGRRLLPLAVGALVVSFASGAGVAVWLRRADPPPAPVLAVPDAIPDAVPEVAPVAAAPPVTAAPAPATAAPAPAEVAPAPPAMEPVAATPEREPLPPAAPVAAPSDLAAERPRGRVASAAPEPAPAPARAPVVRPVPAPPVETARLPEPPPAAAPPPVEPATADVLTRPPPGAPRVRLNFLVWSRVPARRTVTLSIDGGAMVTLHEGEAQGDVAVAQIFADRVHVRWGGQVFSVSPDS